jgi:hypothetical protein
MGLLHCLLHPLAGLDGGMNRRISCSTVAVARNIKGHSRTFDVRFVLLARMIMYDALFAVA